MELYKSFQPEVQYHHSGTYVQPWIDTKSSPEVRKVSVNEVAPAIFMTLQVSTGGRALQGFTQFIVPRYPTSKRTREI